MVWVSEGLILPAAERQAEGDEEMAGTGFAWSRSSCSPAQRDGWESK